MAARTALREECHGDEAGSLDTSGAVTRRNADKASLKRLLDALRGAGNSLRLDECGDWRIRGRCGHIAAWGDGETWSLYVQCRSSRHWTATKQRLDFCRVMQDGDDEGVLRLMALPAPEQAAAIRKALGIRQPGPTTDPGGRHLPAAPSPPIGHLEHV